MLNSIGPRSPSKATFQFSKSIKSTEPNSHTIKVHSKRKVEMRSDRTSFPSPEEIGLCARFAHEAYLEDSTLKGMSRQMKRTFTFLNQISQQIPVDFHKIDEVFAMVQSLLSASESSIPENIRSQSKDDLPFHGFNAIVLTKQESKDIASASLEALGATVSKNPSGNSPAYDNPQHIVVNLDTFAKTEDLLVSWRDSLQSNGILFCSVSTNLFGNSDLDGGFRRNRLKILYSYNGPNNETFVVARLLNESDLRTPPSFKSSSSPNGSGGSPGSRIRIGVGTLV